MMEVPTQLTSQIFDFFLKSNFILKNMLFEGKEENSISVGKSTATSEIDHLKTQIQYQERRIRDLQSQNQRLETKTRELFALKAVRTQQKFLFFSFKFLLPV